MTRDAVIHQAPPSGTRGIVLASPTMSRSDGIGYVGALLQRALTQIIGCAPTIVECEPLDAGVSNLVERARFAARVSRSQAATRPSLVLYNHVGLARVQRWVPSAVRCPHAIFLHGIEAWNSAQPASSVEAMSRASVLIANSSYTARRVRALWPHLDILACPLALLDDTESAAAPDAALLGRVRPDAVLIVGRMSARERYKGHDELLECWGAVCRSIPGAQLVVAGGGDDVDRLKCKAAALGVLDHVLFCGRVSESTKQALLDRAALFAMPSTGEGFGLVYLEAMRRGLACIGAQGSAAADVIADGETGLLVDRDASGALARAIISLLAHSDRRTALGDAGARRYAAQFTLASFCDRLARALPGAMTPRAEVA
jgi:phosphatidylinositol alpha-1,6-mannosyltransferase